MDVSQLPNQCPASPTGRSCHSLASAAALLAREAEARTPNAHSIERDSQKLQVRAEAAWQHCVCHGAGRGAAIGATGFGVGGASLPGCHRYVTASLQRADQGGQDLGRPFLPGAVLSKVEALGCFFFPPVCFLLESKLWAYGFWDPGVTVCASIPHCIPIPSSWC